MMGALIFLLTVAFAVIGAPLFAVIGGSAMVSYWRAGIDMQALIIEFYQLASKPMLDALFLFAFAGCVLGRSRASHRLLRLSNAFLGWLPGGLAIVAIISCSMLTAFTGASGITIVALGGLLLPAMLEKSYDRKFSLGVITASGSLGLLFPPSLPVILYGVISATDIDDLFIAGILPGFLMIFSLVLYSMWCGRRGGIQRTRFSLSEVFMAVWDAKYELPLPIIVIGGIYSGIFAVSEAAVIAAVYVLVVECLINREVGFKQIGMVARQSAMLAGGILIILGMALAATNYMIDAEMPTKMFELSSRYMTSQAAFLATLNVFLLIVGCTIDIFAATVLVVPLIMPIAAEFGVDPVHLGIIFLVNLAIGYVTPPVGLNLFIANIRFREPVAKLYVASLPFVIILLIVLALVTYVPELSLFLLRR